MAADYSNFQTHRSYLRPGEMAGGGGVYDGTSSESSAASPLYSNGAEHLYGEHVADYLRNAYPVQDPETASAMGLIPVELDIEGLYETQDRRRKKSTVEKVVPPHVHSRRRAQNRASQRAFRDRKEKRMKEIEEKLAELQGQHSDLTRSYESLQVEYASVKQELDLLRRKSRDDDAAASPGSGPGPAAVVDGLGAGAWDDAGAEHGQEMQTDPLLFDVSAFCFEQPE